MGTPTTNFGFTKPTVGGDADVWGGSTNTNWDTLDTLLGPTGNAIDNYSAIINGDFDIWQRGTSFSSIANDTYSADRWKYQKSGAMVHDVSRSTDVPTVAQAGRLFNYSILVDCTTVDASISSTDFCAVGHYVEGFMWEPLAQRTLTLSFWVKGTKTGIHTVSLRNSAGDRAFCAEYTINASDTWEFKTVSVTASPSAGTWDYTTGTGIAILWTLAAGSAYQGTNNTWTSGNHLTTANQVNACDSTSNNFRITGVRLVVGSVAKPLIQRPYAQELALSKRYFQTSGGWFGFWRGSATNFFTAVALPVQMRSSPSVTISAEGGAVHDPGIAFRTISAVASSSIGAVGGYIELTTATSSGTNVFGNVQENSLWLSAEL